MKLLKISFITLTALLSATSVWAQTSPLWENTELNAFVPVAVGPTDEPPPEPEPVQLLALSVPATVDAEIESLAEALNNDPVKIFNYVRNTIDYQHYYGLRKGSKLTLLEGAGNDSDQCALLAELLIAAGFSDIQYRHRGHRVDYADLIDWMGLADEPYPGLSYYEAFGTQITDDFTGGNDNGVGDYVAKRMTFAGRFLASRGSKTSLPNGAIGLWYPSFPSKATVVFDRVWLQVTIGGTTYDLDPSYKQYEKIDGIEEILTASGYDRGQLLSNAGGTPGNGYIQSLNQTNIESYLAVLSENLIDELKANYPNISFREIISGRRIVRHEITDLSQAFPLAQNYFGTNNTWAEIPNSHKTKVRFKAGGIDQTLYTSDLGGRKISLTFNGNTAELRLDDASPIDTASISSTSFNMTITVTHPGPIGSKEETKVYKKNNAFAYAIIYGFSPSGRLLQKRYEQLNSYLNQGKADDSKEVRTELLNIMGLTWLYQTQLSDQLLAAQNDVLHLAHHRFGRMAQEEGFYVDVGLQLSGSRTVDGVDDDGRKDNVFHLGSLYASAMEHGIIEQMQPGTSAVSTVNIIRQVVSRTQDNGDGKRVYLADASNWSTIQGQLTNYNGKNGIHDQYEPYTDSNGNGKYDLGEPFTDKTQKENFGLMISQGGAKLFLPANNSVTPKLPDGTSGNWTGSGWVIRSPSEAGMIISGGYSGGYSYWSGGGNNYVSSPSISTSSYYNPTYTYNPPSIPAIKPYVPPSYTTPSFYGSDPVDMATGAFVFSHTDLETGVDPSPRGLSFTRHYSSSGNTRDRQNLGYGWTHMLHMRAAKRTATEEALGLGTPQQAAALLTSTLVASDLYRDDASPKEWGVTALTVGWALDELLDNAVSITIGNNSFQFIEQPDGSFEPPAGSTMELSKDGSGNYILSRQHGNTIYFEPTQDADDESQRVDRIVDPDGKEMTFVYHNDDRINYVQDAYGRRYTFTYYTSGANLNRIQRVTETAGGLTRFVEFRYDSEGNLDRITDPEGKYFYFDYVVAGDPGGTVATDHRIVRMRNHDDETITQNVYDALGRVKEQYLHDDTNKTWKLSYTGVENYEEDPEGGITTYFYDERGRSTGKRDAEGNQTSWRYDGQDRIVEKTTDEGETTIYHYDGSHNITQIDHPRGGGSTVNVYDSLNRLDLATDPDGNQIDYVYFTSGTHSDKNRPQYVIDEEGTTTFAYMDSGPAQGHVWKITDDDNLVTENAYDSYGQPDWTKAPGGFLTDFQYTARGDLDYVIDPNTIRTDFTYNNRRQVTQVIYDQGGADQATEDRAYDNMGNLQSVTSPEDNNAQRVQIRFDYSPTEKLRFEYLRNETATETDDQVAKHVFDGRDWLDYSADAANRQTDMVYFGNGDLEQSIRPGARTSSFIFDGDGRLTSETNPGSPTNRVFGYQYLVSDTAEGDVTTGYPKTVFTDADAKTVTSEYDRRGNLRFYTNKHDDVFETRYDGLGRPTHIITPLDALNSRAHVTTYNHRGEPATITEPSGDNATYTYHPSNGRLQSVAYTDGSTTETVNYTLYDNNGNLKTLTEGTETVQRTFDNLNRVQSYTDADGNTIGYRYYDSGNIAKIIYPGGSETGVGHVEYTYWKTGRLKQVIDKLDSTTTPRVSEFYWHDDGRLHRIVRPNGTERRIKYDAAGRPEIIEEFTSAGQLIALYKNSYFPSDEMEWIYQLPQPQTTGATPAVVNSMSYNANNQLATFEGQTVTHDADGNMTYGPLPDGTFGVYDYDMRNRLESAGGLSYDYGPEGERMGLTGNGDTISYVNENNLGLSKVIQRTKNGQTTRYVWGVGLLYEVDSSGEATYYHYDNVGSTIALTNESEEVIERMEYAPFGTETYRERQPGHEGDLHDTPFLWTGFFGNQTDENGLIYLRNRYYNTLTRRFVNSDPAREGWNWFAYAGGNPIAFVDPTGLGLSSALDAVQTGLSFLGLIPVVGNVFDVVNAGISAARGNYGEAALHAAAALPGIGLAAGGASIGVRTAGRVIRAFERPLEYIGSLQLSRYGSHTLGRNIQRTFVTPVGYVGVSSSSIGRSLNRIGNFQQHHAFIQQRAFRAGSSSNLFPTNPLARRGLERVGNAGINLIPVPAAFNNFLGRSPAATGAFAGFLLGEPFRIGYNSIRLGNGD